MLFSNHNQAGAIASLVCPYLRAKSSKTPIRRIAEPNDELFHNAYRLLQQFGGRKGFFQTECNHVIDSIRLSEHWFYCMHPIIELRSVSPKEAFWTGAGVFKENSATEATLLSEVFAAVGKSSLAPGPAAIVQIDITAIWNEIYSLLEKLDPAERNAENQRQQQAALESIPKYEGPPADPETAAEIERLLAEIRGDKKPKSE
jgi:hypothetical protein